MTVRFHPPEDREAYADKVASVLLRAALAEAQAQLAQRMGGGRRADGDGGAQGVANCEFDREGACRHEDRGLLPRLHGQGGPA